MRLSAALAVPLMLFSGTANADWWLYKGTCNTGLGSLSDSWDVDVAAATNGESCGGKVVSWDGNWGESRMDSSNPCDRHGTKLRYVRDNKAYDIYWNGDSNTKIGRCEPASVLQACSKWNYACSMSRAYLCKSSVCNSG